MKTIVIDPGHGGPDPGARAVDGRLEKEFSLSLSLLVRNALTQGWECRVVLTRETDASVAGPGATPSQELSARAAVANRERADLTLSLHHDSLGNPSARGASMWVWTDRHSASGGLAWLPAVSGDVVNHRAPRSYAYASAMEPSVGQALYAIGVPWRQPPVWCADFAVLRETVGPAVLIECFFGSNPDDVAAIRRPGAIDTLASGIARGVAVALGLPESGATPGTPPPNWDPAAEVRRLKERGLISAERPPEELVNWGELATVINRMLDSGS